MTNINLQTYTMNTVREPDFMYLTGKRRRAKKRMLISNVSTWRQLQHMTQSELAERVGVSRQTINHIENSRRIPTLDVALAIAETLEVGVETLFTLK